MHTKKPLIIATRKSPLALWQARHVQSLLTTHHPGLTVELLPLLTQGDRFLQAPLATIGGKDLFIKELENCLLDDRADMAVHSVKDVAVKLPAGLKLAVMLARGDARDALVCPSANTLAGLPEAACIGTSSLRRQSQLLALRPDLRIRVLRGNLQRRLQRLEEGDFDAILLATAGLQRLDVATQIATPLPLNEFVPAPGQGAIAIECKDDDEYVQKLLQPLHDTATHLCVQAERSFSGKLYGGCQLPIAAHARLVADTLHLDGLVASPDGRRVVRAQRQDEASHAVRLGQAVAEELLAAGADDILQQVLQ